MQINNKQFSSNFKQQIKLYFLWTDETKGKTCSTQCILENNWRILLKKRYFMKRNNMKITSKKIIIRKIFENDSKKKKKVCFFFNEKYNFFSARKFPKVTGQKRCIKNRKKAWKQTLYKVTDGKKRKKLKMNASR